MGQMRSKNYYDVYAWTLKVIESCTYPDQIWAAKKLVHHFGRFYDKNPRYRFKDYCALLESICRKHKELLELES